MKPLTNSQRNCLLNLLKDVLDTELHKTEVSLSLRLGSPYAQKIIQASWNLAIHEAIGNTENESFPELLPFPALKEWVLQTGRLIFYAWEYNESKYQKALLALEELGRREFAQRAHRLVKRACVLCLFQNLTDAIRRKDQVMVTYLSERLKRWGYPTEVAATWSPCLQEEQIQGHRRQS